MNKRNGVLLILTSLLLSSCSFTIGINSQASSSNPTSSNPTSSNPETSSNSQTPSTPISTSEEPSSSSTKGSEGSSTKGETSSAAASSSSISSQQSQEDLGNEIEPTTMNATYKDLVENSVYSIDYCPTQFADMYALVIPIWFTDSSSYIDTSKRESVREDIDAVYFGTEEEIGWHSVKSFYETESLDSIFFQGTTSEWYECGKSSHDFYSGAEARSATNALVVEAVDWYFENHKTDGETRAKYDSDRNGFLDAVHLIYGAPDYSTMRNNSASNLWAYTYWIQNRGLKNVNKPGPNAFFWASYDFIYGRNAQAKTGHPYGAGDTSFCTLDSHTFVHEMGHVFGLEDYYDYANGNLVPAGAFSMQDRNIGGHDPFSVLTFGWADPYIPTESCTLKIRPFQSSHDLILLSPEWNRYDSPFDEYLLLELYTPTGLNKHDVEHNYDYYDKGPNATGIRLWHVDAKLTHCEAATADSQPIWSEDLITDPYYPSRYGLRTAFTNTSSGAEYGSPLGSAFYKYDLLHLIRNSTSERLQTTASLRARDLFYDGDSFSMSTFSSQFPEGNRLDDGTSLGWSFDVEIEGIEEDAIATIRLTKTA